MRRLNASQWLVVGLILLQLVSFRASPPDAGQSSLSIVQFAVIMIVILGIMQIFRPTSPDGDDTRLPQFQRGLAQALKRVVWVTVGGLALLVAREAARTGRMPSNNGFVSFVGWIGLAAIGGREFLLAGTMPAEQASHDVRVAWRLMAGFGCALLGAVYAFHAVRYVAAASSHGSIVDRFIDPGALVPAMIAAVLFVVGASLRARARRLETRR